MKKYYLLFILIIFTVFITRAQIVDIPDPVLKNNLINLNVVDTNNDGVGDSDADTNDDGEIQVSEAEAVINLLLILDGILTMEGIESFINLEKLRCHGNLFPSIDVSQMSNLKWLDTSTNLQLTSLDVSQNTQLEFLDCRTSNMNSLDVSNNLELKHLSCAGNNLIDIDVSNNTLLEYLNVGGQNIVTLDISQNIALEYLGIAENNFTEIDLSNNTNLVELHCQENQITNLDVSFNPNLEVLNCSDNFITNLELSNNLLLRGFICQRSSLTSLDLSQNTELVSAYFNDNQLTNVNLRNGNNENILFLYAYDNPNLTCIQVDEVEYATNAPNWVKDETVIYSEDCSLGLNEVSFAKIIFYPNPAKDVLMLYNDNESIIESVKVYDVLGKLVLEHSNSSNQIDISNLSSGLLFVQIETDKGIISKKVIKN